MDRAAGCRVLAIMGSGETSPTMVTVHRALASRLTARPSAVLLDTPYAFQENAADVSARAQAYFARSVGLDVTVTSGGPAALRAADWAFSGPGSPTYALGRWQHDGTAQSLRDRIAARTGVTVMASAAAAAIGCAALPVYEIYKAGAAPHWLDGLDLTALCGLRVAVIPHYDNTEGGTHDTRYCYLGERRLAALERELPDGAAVLGVDEHTAAIIDLDTGQVQVAGRGTVTVRRTGRSTALPAGTVIPLDDLRRLTRHGAGAVTTLPAASGPASGADPPSPAPGRAATLTEITTAAADAFDAAADARDAPAMTAAILDLEQAVSDWAADTEEDQGTTQSRAALRGLISRLGDFAAATADAPGERLAVAVAPLLALRADLRAQGLYPAADTIRDALTMAGLQIRDTAEGTHWTLPHRLPGALSGGEQAHCHSSPLLGLARPSRRRGRIRSPPRPAGRPRRINLLRPAVGCRLPSSRSTSPPASRTSR